MKSGVGVTVGVSIVHWNGGDTTLRCIESVLEQGVEPARILVVDNGSSDAVMSTIATRWPGLHTLRNADNLGFTGGHNQGFAWARAQGLDCVLALNQDAILMPQALEHMVSRCEADERVGLVSPVIYYRDEPTQIQFAGSWVDWAALEIRSSADFDEVARRADADETICLWGTALLVRLALVDEVGGFDPAFFAYFEDLDLCVRAAKAGWKARMAFDAGILHDGHRGWRKRSPHYFYFMNRNVIAFWRKHIGRERRTALWRHAAAKTAGEIGNLRDAGMPVHADACLLALRDAWRGRGGSFDPTRRPPALLRALIAPHPHLFARLVRGNFRSVLGDIKSRSVTASGDRT